VPEHNIDQYVGVVVNHKDVVDSTHPFPVTVVGGSGGAPTEQPVSVANGKDVVEGALADAAVTSDANGTVSGKLRGLVKWAYERMPAALGQGTMAQSVPVVLPSDQVVQVGGKIVAIAAAELTRPSDTNQYTALDAISDSTSAPTLLTFSNVARANGGSGYITLVRMMTDQSTFTGQLRIHFFHTAPSAINDNAPYTLLYANRANRIGHVDLSVGNTEGTGSTAANARCLSDGTNLPLPFVCAGSDRNIYAMIETLTTFNPASGQKFYFELRAELQAA
jgi:hypothetical protein